MRFQIGRQIEDKQVEQQTHDDERKFQHHEFNRAVFITQSCKQNGLESIESHDDGHDFHKLGMCGVI